MSAPLVILGCGYLGTRLARAALAAGRPVRVCSKSTGKLAPLAELGAEVKYIDAAIPKQLPTALSGLPGGTVVYGIPPVTSLPQGRAIGAALQAAYGARLACFIHLSSAGMYGADPDDDAWIDEDTPTTHDPAMSNMRGDEDEIERSTFDRLRTVILRLAPVYGPGRGMRAQLRKGTFRILDDGQHASSRIYIDDFVRVVTAAEQLAAHRSRFLVADDEPTTQGEYATWLCERLGLPLPPSRQRLEPGAPRVAHRNRRIRNTRLKAALGLTLQCPSFREGEAALDAHEAAIEAAP